MKHQIVDVTIPSNLLSLIEKSRKPNQTLNDRIVELIGKGLEAQKKEDDAATNAQLDELIKEGKIYTNSGVVEFC
jgi:hypothetical protein